MERFESQLHECDSEDSIVIAKKKNNQEVRRFIEDLGQQIDMQKMLDANPDCSVDRLETEQRLIISHAFMQRYLFTDSKVLDTPNAELDKPKSFYKFLCPLCLKLIYRCVTAVCGHSFCEMCLDEYLLIKSVSSSSYFIALDLLRLRF